MTRPQRLPSHVVWMANHESGNMAEWKKDHPTKPNQDSGVCMRPGKGVTREKAHTGNYALKMSIQSWFPHSGCRTFRYPEIKSGTDYYYSAWILFPVHYTVNGWTNIMQFKAKPLVGTGGSTLFWVLRLLNRENGAMYFQLQWDKENKLPGPTIQDPIGARKIYDQTIVDVKPNTWTHVELFLKQSSEFEGQIVVWQDGIEIFNITDIRTKMPDGYNTWSINSYGGDITPDPFTVYVDDAAISSERLGPEFSDFSL